MFVTFESKGSWRLDIPDNAESLEGILESNAGIGTFHTLLRAFVSRTSSFRHSAPLGSSNCQMPLNPLS